MGRILADPAPSDVEEFNTVTVSPGLSGFIAMFILAVIVVLLVIDMTRRVRRVQARERVENRMAEADRTEPGEADPSAPADSSGSAEPTATSDGDDDTDDANEESRREDPPLS